MTDPIISVSGLRGVLGESLTPEVALRYVAAFAADLPAGPVVVSCDGRASGPMLAALIGSGLQALGRDCLDAGVAATPTLGVLVRSLGAAAGVQISASHNPPQYNGLKLFGSDGRVIPQAAGEAVIQRYRAGQTAWATYDRLGTQQPCADTLRAHRDLVTETVDVAQIRRRRFKVLLDANHGSGGVLGRPLLETLGCEVIGLGETPDGQFAHPPEPTQSNLQSVFGAVTQHGADIGFCQDPDADRLAIIDADGRYLGEEYTLALCVDHLLRQRPGPIVTNCSTSRMSEDLANRYGAPFFRSPVGEANVVDVMLAEQAVLGGEGNGGVIDPRVVLVRDSFVSMAMVLDAMAARERTVAELAEELPRYEICKTKITLAADRVPAALDVLQTRFQDAEADRMDGLRLNWPDRWLLVRASNTEPIVRAIAEAPTATAARQLCDEAARVLAPLAD